jgi:hypothetical protein
VHTADVECRYAFASAMLAAVDLFVRMSFSEMYSPPTPVNTAGRAGESPEVPWNTPGGVKAT